eukprot:TRINITY_DN555_c0_g1_i22.p6 TRINITY_DN555_c0_g1~~TRINITY_DN555_c0_g1_i22.p6  ORF type:complete len:117 (-),score=11.89 TRINITY_DN555_c0_g1_i22:56-406(-)
MACGGRDVRRHVVCEAVAAVSCTGPSAAVAPPGDAGPVGGGASDLRAPHSRGLPSATAARRPAGGEPAFFLSCSSSGSLRRSPSRSLPPSLHLALPLLLSYSLALSCSLLLCLMIT